MYPENPERTQRLYEHGIWYISDTPPGVKLLTCSVPRARWLYGYMREELKWLCSDWEKAWNGGTFEGIWPDLRRIKVASFEVRLGGLWETWNLWGQQRGVMCRVQWGLWSEQCGFCIYRDLRPLESSSYEIEDRERERERERERGGNHVLFCMVWLSQGLRIL